MPARTDPFCAMMNLVATVFFGIATLVLAVHALFGFGEPSEVHGGCITMYLAAITAIQLGKA